MSDKQVGGTHYKDMGIQPKDYFFANSCLEEIRGAMRWNIQKYIWRDKGTLLEDLMKAQHYIEMWIEQEEKHNESFD